MARYKTGVEKQAESRKRRAMLIVIGIALATAAGGGWFIKERADRLAIDEHLCPPQPESFLAVLVDVTDPMSLPQRQDLRNKLEELKDSVGRYGKIVIFKVDASREQLLSPVLEVCNPGSASDVSGISADPKAIQKTYQEKYQAPVDRAFQQLMVASGSEASPILQSIQSVALTELKEPQARDKPQKLIVISDLLQNTKGLSFYGRRPSAEEVMQSSEFATARTDLRGVDVELWMLQRPDFSTTQPRGLADLWDQLITAQGGNVTSVYRVSG
jgi:hypothetical protein